MRNKTAKKITRINTDYDSFKAIFRSLYKKICVNPCNQCQLFITFAPKI